MKVFKSGATSTVEKLRYDLVPKQLAKFAATRFGFGVSRGHAEDNWKAILIDPEFRRDRANHAYEHFLNWMESFHRDGLGDRDQLEAVICNLSMFAWLFEQEPPTEETFDADGDGEVNVSEDIDDIIYSTAQTPAPVVEAEVIKTPEPPAETPESAGKNILSRFLSNLKI